MREMLFSAFFETAAINVYYKQGLSVKCDRLVKEGGGYYGKHFSMIIEKKKSVYFPVLQWNSRSPSVLQKIEFVSERYLPGEWSFFKHGYQSWTVSRSYRNGDIPLPNKRPWYVPVFDPVAAIQDNLNNLQSGRAGEYNSESFALLKNLSNDTCELAGVAGDFHDFVYFRFVCDCAGIRKITITYDYEKYRLPYGTTARRLEPITIDAGYEEDVFEKYFSDIRTRKKPSVPAKIPFGWCSWYYYFTDITVEKILANLDVCKTRKLKLDYFQIDDGWQRHVGDWLDMAPGFETKMPYLAEHIHRAGYRAGIWMAPFIATVKSRLYREHPEFFIKNPLSLITRGKSSAGFNPNWKGGFFFGLDCTHPDAIEYIRSVIRTASVEWGYDVLKLDFLYAAALSGVCRDNSHTRAERLQHGLRAIRDAAEKNTFIIGCGIPMMQGIGIVNGNRIGEDVAPYWTGKDEAQWGGESHVGTRNALRNTINRLYMHKRLWLNDPDCLMIRETETELSPSERKLLRDVICISGGMLVISDDLGKLSDREMKAIREAMSFSKKMSAGEYYPVGIMNSSHPNCLFNTRGALCVMNFSDETSVLHPDRRQLLRLFKRNSIKASAKLIGEDGRDFTLATLCNGIQLPPHSSMIFTLAI